MLRRLLLNDRVIFALIIVNAVAIFALGFPSVVGPVRGLLVATDVMITIAFVLEAVFKIRRDSFRGYWADGWNRFDFILVALALPSLADLFLSADLSGYGLFLMLRTARSAKLLRSYRFFPEIDGLIAGVLRAAKSSLLVSMAFAISLLIFALVSQRIFGGIAPEHFGNPVRALYSTFKVFTVEGWFDIPDEVAEGLPEWAALFTRIYFSFLLLGGGIFGLSLVNSIFVDAMVADNNDELEEKVDLLTEEVRRMRDRLEER